MNKLYKILVVDDEQDVREVLQSSFQKKFKASVTCSDNGATAVEIARTLKPDLILLDIHLPGHMGWDVLSEIRAFDQAVKIIIVTAVYAIPPENEEMILQETSGYLTKPLNLDDIAKKVVEVMGPDILL